MAKKFDVKQFMLLQGERVGLYAAAGLAVLLLVLGLRNAFSSPAGNKKALDDSVARTKQTMARTPSADEAAEISRVDQKLIASIKFDAVSVDPFVETLAYFQQINDNDTKRRAPKLVLPDELRTAVARAQVRSFILDSRMEKILVLQGAGGEKGGGSQPGFGMLNGGKRGRGGMNGPGTGGTSGEGRSGSSRGGPPPGMMGGATGGTAGGLRPQGQGDLGSGKADIKWVKVEELDNLSDGRPAEDILPLRMAIIVGTFPYKQQLEEYRKALRFTSAEEVLQAGLEPQFAGFEVERAEVRSDQPEPQWQPLDLKKTFGPVALISGMPDRSEPEETRLEQNNLIYPNLVVKLPKQFREKQYPHPEENLKNLKDTIEKLKEAAQGTVIKPKNKFKDPDGIDIFGGPAPETGGAGATTPPMGNQSKTGSTTPSPSGGDVTVPEHILLRFVDVTIKPNTSYKYRFRVRLLNPNYKEKNVAWASLAAEKEVKTDWAYVPGVVRVPQELFYYVVDLKTQGDREDKRRFWQERNPNANQVVAQIQEWVEAFFPDPAKSSVFTTVGDWVVAERVMIGRGEYVGQQVQTDVPVWDVREERFAPAVSSVGNKRTKQVPVFFGIGRENGPWEPILVDFNGGDLRYERYLGYDEEAQKPKTSRVNDKGPYELIVMGADGKLSVRTAQNDLGDQERIERYDTWKSRIEDVKPRDKPKGNTPPGSDPFGK
jgi:hypothetical protein